MPWWNPRTIRSQLVAGLIFIEILSLLLFGLLLYRHQNAELAERIHQRLAHQAESLAQSAARAMAEGDPGLAVQSLEMATAAPSVSAARITDLGGANIVVRADRGARINPGAEMAYLRQQPPGNVPHVFRLPGGGWEGVEAIVVDGAPRGYAWVYSDEHWDTTQITSLIRLTLLFGFAWMLGSIVLAWFLSRSITRPLESLLRATRSVVRSPGAAHEFPLSVAGSNEIADLTVAFNLMVASVEEQRDGLNDTLSLLDSMLANAPVGFAFLDRRARFVRVNRYFAELTGQPVAHHLGRGPEEVMQPQAAAELQKAVERVFETGEACRDLELASEADAQGPVWSWLASFYPVRSSLEQVRWVGVVVMDTSERRRSEDALRKTEKLAATGRLAASIAHEINNPLEAVTNLLYLLRMHEGMDERALAYTEMAQHEVARVSEITQQTLRFYRQSTQAAVADLGELLNSVLSLHQARLQGLNIVVERRYGAGASMLCFAGEMRQVFANLVGNAIDAMPAGGRLLLRVRRSRGWHAGAGEGVRVVVADTGTGMPEEIRRRIFEAFFTTKEDTGTGLGLWVSQEIIAKHGGTVRVRSRRQECPQSPGQPPHGGAGTVFMLYFPLDRLASGPDPKKNEPEQSRRQRSEVA